MSTGMQAAVRRASQSKGQLSASGSGNSAQNPFGSGGPAPATPALASSGNAPPGSPSPAIAPTAAGGLPTSTYRSTKGLQLRAVEYREPTSRIQGHNFAIRLLQTVESHMDTLKRTFVEKGHARKGLSKDAFVDVVCKCVREGPKSVLERSWLANVETVVLRHEVVQLFEGIDSNGEGYITFDAFLSHVIDCSLHGHIGRVDEPIPEYTTTGCSYLKNLDEVHFAKYIPELEQIVTVGKTIGVVQPGSLQTRSMLYSTTSTKDKFPTVYDADFIPALNALLCVGTELSIHIIDLRTGKKRFSIPAKDSFTSCAFDRTTNVAFCASRHGELHTYRLSALRASDSRYETGIIIRNHTQMITKILPLERDALVATSSLDCTVFVQNGVTGTVLTQFIGHTSGVMSLTYIRYMNFLASCAYDIEPKVWMVSSVATRSDSFVLQDIESPHIGHVVDMVAVPNAPQIVTMDQHGLIKVWDVRNFRCVQDIRAEKHMTGVVAISHVRWHTLVWSAITNEIAVFSMRRVQLFHRAIPVLEGNVVTEQKPAISRTLPLSDEHPIACMELNRQNQTIITAAHRKLQIWDAFSGKLEVLLERVTKSPITALAVADSGKKFFLGTAEGQISSHVYSTGVVIYVYAKDGSEVLDLTYLSGSGCFSVTTWDECRIIYDRASYAEGLVTYIPDSSKRYDINVVGYDEVFNILSLGERSGELALWEGRKNRFTADSVRCIGGTKLEGRITINAVMMLTGYPMVVVADNTGTMSMFTTSPHPHPNALVGKFTERHREIFNFAWYPPRRVLYTGNDSGTVHAFALQNVFKTVNVSSGSASWEAVMNSIGRFGIAPKSVTVLEPFNTIRAHEDAITGMLIPPGSGVLVTASADRRIVAWTLNLRLRGEFDPLSPTGQFTAPFCKGKGTAHIFATALDDDLPEILEAGDATPSMDASDAGSRPGSPASPGNSNVPDTSAPMASPRSILQRDGPPAQSRKTQPLSAPKRPASRTPPPADGAKVTPPPPVPGGQRPSSAAEEDAFLAQNHLSAEERKSIAIAQEAKRPYTTKSANSAGVAVNEFFGRPTSPQHYQEAKEHVVDSHETASDTASVGFTVVRNCPAQPMARAERDYQIRILMDKQAAERAAAELAASVGVENELPKTADAVQRNLGRLYDFLPPVAANGMDVGLPVRRQLNSRSSVLSRTFGSDGSAGLRSELNATLRSLLPSELIAIRGSLRSHPLLQPSLALLPPMGAPVDSDLDWDPQQVHFRPDNSRGGFTPSRTTTGIPRSRSTTPGRMASALFDDSLSQQRAQSSVGNRTLGIRTIPMQSFRRGGTWEKTHRVSDAPGSRSSQRLPSVLRRQDPDM